MKEVKHDNDTPNDSVAPEKEEEKKDDLSAQMEQLKIDEDLWSYDKLVQGLRDNKYKKEAA